MLTWPENFCIDYKIWLENPDFVLIGWTFILLGTIQTNSGVSPYIDWDNLPVFLLNPVGQPWFLYLDQENFCICWNNPNYQVGAFLLHCDNFFIFLHDQKTSIILDSSGWTTLSFSWPRRTFFLSGSKWFAVGPLYLDWDNICICLHNLVWQPSDFIFF